MRHSMLVYNCAGGEANTISKHQSSYHRISRIVTVVHNSDGSCSEGHILKLIKQVERTGQAVRLHHIGGTTTPAKQQQRIDGVLPLRRCRTSNNFILTLWGILLTLLIFLDSSIVCSMVIVKANTMEKGYMNG
uniref:Uncharacterized protein n=1 Tax=Anopheles culicifacies TaxID=139723 RepID=A0A182M0L0_9DIPT